MKQIVVLIGCFLLTSTLSAQVKIPCTEFNVGVPVTCKPDSTTPSNHCNDLSDVNCKTCRYDISEGTYDCVPAKLNHLNSLNALDFNANDGPCCRTKDQAVDCYTSRGCVQYDYNCAVTGNYNINCVLPFSPTCSPTGTYCSRCCKSNYPTGPTVTHTKNWWKSQSYSCDDITSSCEQ